MSDPEVSAVGNVVHYPHQLSPPQYAQLTTCGGAECVYSLEAVASMAE